jgi:hypothetical protein
MVTKQSGGLEAIVDSQLAASTVAIGVDRRLGHAELARDFLRAEMLVDESQAFALTLGEQLDRVLYDRRTRGHGDSVKPYNRHFVYFAAHRPRLRQIRTASSSHRLATA